MQTLETVTELKNAIAHYPDFPKPGILFQDLSPLFKDKHLYKKLLDLLTAKVTALGEFDYVIGIEARGFILGAALASRMHSGFIPLRKKGKLPGEITQVKYDLEYGTDILEIQHHADLHNKKLLVIDDIFATGGTLKGAIQLLKKYSPQLTAMVLLDIGITDIKQLGQLGIEYAVLLK